MSAEDAWRVKIRELMEAQLDVLRDLLAELERLRDAVNRR
jgi:hypothetical protein